MADWSKVKMGDVVCGLWIRDPQMIKDSITFTMWMVMAGIPENLVKKRPRIVPNKYNDAGGVFVMFGRSKAPGE